MPFCRCCPDHDGLSQSLGLVNALEHGSDVKVPKPAIAPAFCSDSAQFFCLCPRCRRLYVPGESVDPCALGHAGRDRIWPSARRFFAERVSPCLRRRRVCGSLDRCRDRNDRRVVRLAGRLSVAQVPELLTVCADSRILELDLTDLMVCGRGRD